MMKRLKRKFLRRTRRIRRAVKQQIYRFLVAIYEGDIRISLFDMVCAIGFLILLIGFLLPKGTPKQLSAVLPSYVTEGDDVKKLSPTSGHSALSADISLFLLTEDSGELLSDSEMNAPLYGFYLTGKEISYLPEYFTSLSKIVPGYIPYVGGLSFSYNPMRVPYNRVTDTSLISRDGTHSPLVNDVLYYVVSTESAFTLFHYLSGQTFRLMSIVPKDVTGAPLTDSTKALLHGSGGSYTLAGLAAEGNLSAALSAIAPTGEIYRCRSLNTSQLFTSLNPAGYFIFGCTLLLIVLAFIIEPYLRRICVLLRLFRIRRKKQGRIPMRDRIQTAYERHFVRRKVA